MEVIYREADVSDLTTTRVVVATAGEKVIGFATWDDQTKTLEMVRVHKRHRRQGHGSELVRRADELAGCTLLDNGTRSPEGTQLLRSMGRRLKRIEAKVKPESCGATMMLLLQGRHLNDELNFK